MRVQVFDVPFLLLLALPVYVAAYDYGVVSTLVTLVLWFLLRQAIVYYKLRSRLTDQRVILETQPVSHYVEKVRWAMDKLNEPYEEQPDAGIIMLLLTARFVPVLHYPGKNISIANSSDILRYLYGIHSHDEKRSAFLKPTAEALALERRIDKMGQDLRRYVYYHTVVIPDAGEDNALAMWGLHHHAVPTYQKYILKATCPLLKAFLINRLKLTAEGAADGLRLSKELFRDTDAMLSDGRKFLLNTDEPTFVDIALASLGAVLAAPENYGGPRAINDASRIKMSMASPVMQKEIKEFRNTPTGKHILKMYKEFR